MKAIILKEFGGIENLKVTDLPDPDIKENEVLIQVKAISINPVDVKTRVGEGMAGRLKEEKPLIIGWDVSGVITASRSLLFNIGDEVFGMVNFPGHGRAYAEYVAAPADQLSLKPANISHYEAAAATLSALTAWQNLTKHARLKAGQRILIHAASGGVGHYAIQMARHLGAYVIGTSSANNREFALSLGVDEFIDYKAQRFEEATSNIDFVLDTIGGDNIDRSLEVMKRGGTLISIPTGLNEEVKQKARDKGINGFNTLVGSNGHDMKEIADLLKTGSVKSYISQAFVFEDIGQAHLQIESGKTKGKIVVVI